MKRWKLRTSNLRVLSWIRVYNSEQNGESLFRFFGTPTSRLAHGLDPLSAAAMDTKCHHLRGESVAFIKVFLVFIFHFCISPRLLAYLFPSPLKSPPSP